MVSTSLSAVASPPAAGMHVEGGVAGHEVLAGFAEVLGQ